MKIVSADITGSLIVNGVDVTNNVVSSSIFSGSIAGRVTNLEAFSASLDATFATDASVSASILVLSQSVQASQAALSSSYTLTSGSYVIVSGSYALASGSLSTRVTSLEQFSSSLDTIFATDAQVTASILVLSQSVQASEFGLSSSLSTRLTTDETNITTLTNASASFAVASGSLSTRVTNLESTSSTVSSSFATTSGSLSSRVTIIEGQDATTGSNTFTGVQYISQASNAISFTSTASLYTDGGLRVAKDSFVSGTAYFNNITVYGTSSIQYITSSQVNIGSNIITVNTDTPAIRFGGLSVFDSGSTGLTGSIFWDSEKNHWIYSNPSGSSYNSAMLMNGPRNTGSLGDEQGTTNNALMKGQGGDHITSSQIIDDGTTVRIPGNLQVTGSTILSSAAFTGSVNVSGSFVVTTTAPELTVGATGVILGNVLTDVHQVTGSLRVTGSGVSYFLGGNVGVGTTSLTATNGANLEVANATVARVLVTQAGTRSFSISAESNAFYLYDQTANATRLYVSGSGNIGIGTTSPFADTNYAGVYVGGSSGGQLNLGNSTGGSANRYLQLQGDATGGYIQSIQNTPLYFFTNATKRMQIYESGEVAIIGAAATEAAWGLIVNEANNNNLIIYAGGSGTATKGIILKTTTGTATVNALSLASTGAATFSSSGANLATFKTNNATDSYNSGVILAGNANETQASRNAYILLDPNGANGTGTDYAFFTALGTGETQLGISKSDGFLALYTADTEKVRITSGGKMQITTNSSYAPAQNFPLTINAGAGSSGIQLTNAQGSYTYLVNDGTYFIVASDAGTTGEKFRVSRNAPDNAVTILSNGNTLIGTTTDNSYKLAVPSGTQHLGSGFVVNNDFTTTGRQCATAINDFSGTTCTFDLATIFPRVTFLNRGLSVTMQLIAIPTYTIASGGFVVLTRTGNSNVWSNSILANININGAGINSVSASGTTITIVYSTQISGTAYINLATIG